MLGLLLAFPCSAALQDGPVGSDQRDGGASSKTQEQTGRGRSETNEFVEITIRLPDGRVLKRFERRIASEQDPRLLKFPNNKQPVLTGQRASSGKDVRKTGGAVSGGAGGAGGSSKHGSSSSGGGGGASGGFSGGNGGSGGSDSSDGSEHLSEDLEDLMNGVEPDHDFTMRFYAWDQSGPEFEHVIQAVVVDPRPYRGPEHLAEHVAQVVRERNDEQVVLRFWKELVPSERYPFDISNPRELIESGGFDYGLTEYWRAFAVRLQELEIKPDYLVFDMEKGVGFWQIPTDERPRFFSQLLDDERSVLSGIPSSLWNVDVDELVAFRTQSSRLAVRDYDSYAREFRSQFLHRVFCDAFEGVYGEQIPTSNFADLLPSFDVYQYTDVRHASTSMNGISAPALYLEDRGPGAMRYKNLSKNRRWNRLIDNLNAARSASTNGLVTPWIAPPGYARDAPDTWADLSELDEEFAFFDMMMSHLMAMGIDTYILWNPTNSFNPIAHVSDPMVDDWLGRHPRVRTHQLRDLPEIPLDADVIETNGVVTTYQDFLRIMNLDDSEED
ncbi:MAG: hypothetical protein CMJ35_15490 [Phycisphaerae bacterium]|nr:hypothetical protein [Phycisphaerae bacterium]MBM92991.1 hypothetical protein [Phycisphaerae bacterium]